MSNLDVEKGQHGHEDVVPSLFLRGGYGPDDSRRRHSFSNVDGRSYVRRRSRSATPYDSDEAVRERGKSHWKELKGDKVPVNNFTKRMRTAYKRKANMIETTEDNVSVHLTEYTRVCLENMQRRLLMSIFDFAYGKFEDIDDFQDHLDSAQETISAYVDTWKDLEFMTEFRKRRGYDPFIVTTSFGMQRAMLQDVESHWRASNAESLNEADYRRYDSEMRPLTVKHSLSDARDEDNVKRFGGGTRSDTIQERFVQEYTEKVAMAVAGGAFLIVPMLIMVLHPGLATSLATTSVFVFVFGLVMAYYLQAPFDVLSGTAAYAAVLVVFVGVGGGS